MTRAEPPKNIGGYQYPDNLEPYKPRDLSSAGGNSQLAVEKKGTDEGRDWLLDPVNLYMKGMAKRREQMQELQQQLQQEQRAEIQRRLKK